MSDLTIVMEDEQIIELCNLDTDKARRIEADVTHRTADLTSSFTTEFTVAGVRYRVNRVKVLYTRLAI